MFDMETLLLNTIPEMIMGNPTIVSAVLGVTGLQWVGKIYLAMSHTKASKWYKLVELACMIWGKAKEDYKK